MARVPRPPLEQGWAYGEGVSETSVTTARRGVVSYRGAPLALAQVFERRVAGLMTVGQVLRGPVFVDGEPSGALRRAVFRRIRNAYRLSERRVAYWMPELPDTPETHATMRDCGMRRVVTGHTTVWIDLRSDLAGLRRGLDSKWRNKLVKAERAGLTVDDDPTLLDWLLGQYDTMRRRRRFIAAGAQTVRAIVRHAPPEDVMVLTARASGAPVAGILVLINGATATYFAGWSGDAGRRVGAHNLLLWRAVTTLHAGGIAWLDLGGVNTVRTPGIARFKLGMGGALFTLAGSYL